LYGVGEPYLIGGASGKSSGSTLRQRTTGYKHDKRL